ncbi:unnamed protein product [Paramecium pentaurelia]|uniref:Uncharacterized protein n=1 Tax=Paramecium pentaurelia TaxID=43138 RepID=A0A8S1TJC7_9CILI|nr:unnamed protein product [Paramecium pentaurelia]
MNYPQNNLKTKQSKDKLDPFSLQFAKVKISKQRS